MTPLRLTLIILGAALYLFGILFTQAWIYERSHSSVDNKRPEAVVIAIIWPFYWLNEAATYLAAPSQPSPEKKP